MATQPPAPPGFSHQFRPRGTPVSPGRWSCGQRNPARVMRPSKGVIRRRCSIPASAVGSDSSCPVPVSSVAASLAQRRTRACVARSTAARSTPVRAIGGAATGVRGTCPNRTKVERVGVRGYRCDRLPDPGALRSGAAPCPGYRGQMLPAATWVTAAAVLTPVAIALVGTTPVAAGAQPLVSESPSESPSASASPSAVGRPPPTHPRQPPRRSRCPAPPRPRRPQL